MGAWVDRMGLAWLDGALAVSVVVGLIALAMVGTGQPARRCLLARAAILASLAVVPLGRLAPVPRIFLAAPTLDLLGPDRAHAPRPTRPPLLHAARPFFRPLVVMGLVGTAAGLVWLMAGSWGAARLAGRSIEPSPETEAVYESLPFGGPGRRPRLRVVARVGRPVLLGLLRPTILIPTDLDQPGRTEPLRLGLLHELAHAERLDPAFTTCGTLAQAVWFFLPPLWWARRQMRLDQEFLADRRSSGRYGPALVYASSLVDLADPTPTVRPTPDAPRTGVGASPSALIQRVMMLIRCPFPVEDRAPRWWTSLMLATVAALTWSASGLTLRPHPGPLRPPACWDSGGRHGRLRIERLGLHATDLGPAGPDSSYTLLPTMPDRFVLEADVWADPNDYSRVAIAGRRLGPPPSSPIDPPPFDGYHRLKIVRDERGLSVWLGDQLVPPQPADTPPPLQLLVEPSARQSIRFRDLRIEW